MKILFCFVILFFNSASLMAKGDLKSIETEDAAEWIYFAVMADHSKNEVVEIIETTLDSAFSKEPLITEAEINDYIETGLFNLKYEYDEGEITKEEYDKWSLEYKDRELVKKELIEADAGGSLEDSHAASEFLAALLGKPGIAFDHALDAYGDEFATQFKKISQDYDKEKLSKLLPKAFKVIEKLKDKESIKSLGYYGEDIKVWLDAVNQLEGNLLASQ